MVTLGVIDAQNDFMLPDGKLYVPGAEKIIPKLEEYVTTASNLGFDIFFTSDCHDGAEAEMEKNGGPFPLHCMEGTDGQRLVKGLEDLAEAYQNYTKKCYDIFHPELGNTKFRDYRYDLSKKCLGTGPNRPVVFIAGVVGNICVEAAALGLAKFAYNVILIEDAIVWMDIDDNNNEHVSRKTLKENGVKFIKSFLEI